MTGTSFVYRNVHLLEIIKNYYQLTKPRIIPLLLITTAASVWIASKGKVDFLLLSITLLGGTLAAASAQVLNCIYDQDIDYTMLRTRNRPLPAGDIQSQHALLFAVILGLLSFSVLSLFVNLLAALLAMSGILFYMLVYTHWLKRHTVQNIVIGGAAGSIPPLVGWASVTGDLSWTAWLLSTIIFLWTPPHFWSLALMIKEDYAQVGVPMLPVVKGEEVTVKQIWLYVLLVIPCSLLLVYSLGTSGIIYGAIALILNIVLLRKAWQLKQSPTNKQLARSLFKYSIFYMMLLCTTIIVVSLPITQHLATAIVNKYLNLHYLHIHYLVV
ncbi:MAG: heme o synthase [Rivularia sp. (in: Bacteria)]|nr:heme o synthase [Rivularia sp. MS3]